MGGVNPGELFILYGLLDNATLTSSRTCAQKQMLIMATRFNALRAGSSIFFRLLEHVAIVACLPRTRSIMRQNVIHTAGSELCQSWVQAVVEGQGTRHNKALPMSGKLACEEDPSWKLQVALALFLCRLRDVTNTMFVCTAGLDTDYINHRPRWTSTQVHAGP